MGRTLGKVKFSLTEGQLLKHVYLVNKMMRYHETHLNDKECPICQGEEEFQTSSMNSGKSTSKDLAIKGPFSLLVQNTVILNYITYRLQDIRGENSDETHDQ
jgi:hypothetical protein